MNARDAFLQRVRLAVVEGNRRTGTPSLPQRGAVGYQGAGADPAERFRREFSAAGGFYQQLPDAEAAWKAVVRLLRDKQARKIVLERCPLLERLELARRLRQEGYQVAETLPGAGAALREEAFGADVGITGVRHLVAETGSLVMTTSPETPRGTSLLPPVHLALAEPRQILPDLFDLFDLFSPESCPDRPAAAPPPACLTVITGPSKTGDIELTLVTGVHGPGEVHVLLVG